MKVRPIISSIPVALALLLVTVVITPDGGAALYQGNKNKDETNTGRPTQVRPGQPEVRESAPSAPPAGGSGARRTPANRGPSNPTNGQGGTQRDSQPGPDGGAAGATIEEPTGGQAQNNLRAQTAATAPPENKQQEESLMDSIFYYGLWAVGVLLALLVLAFIGYTIKILLDSSRERTEAYFAGVKDRQDEYARLTNAALTKLNTSMNQRMSDMQSEIKELRRSLQDDNRALLDATRRVGATSSAYAGYSPTAGYAAPAPRVEKDEPTFPASAEEFLNKMRRGSVVVKPDFQNGILVQDAEGSGEFVLVRDYGAPDELLYVVPRVGYFQTKQDFYNYYDRYYDCQRPSSGTIWIVQPAVVDRVSGGWTLREKGELEVR